MGPFLRYTLLRLAVLAVVGGLLWLVGLRGPLWALASVAVAAGVSYLALTGAREDVLARWDGRRPVDGEGAVDGEQAVDGERRADGGERAAHDQRRRAPTDEEVEDARTEGADPDQRG